MLCRGLKVARVSCEEEGGEDYRRRPMNRRSGPGERDSPMHTEPSHTRPAPTQQQNRGLDEDGCMDA